MNPNKILTAQSYVIKGRIEDAIELVLEDIKNDSLHRDSFLELEKLKDTFKSLYEREWIKGEDSTKIKRERKEVVETLHSFLSQFDTQSRKAEFSSSEIQSKFRVIKFCISINNIFHALELIDEIQSYYPEFSRDLTLLSYRWSENEKRMHQGVLRESDYLEEKNQIASTLFQVLKQIEQQYNIENVPQEEIQSIVKAITIGKNTELNLSGKGLSSIPVEFNKLSTLKIINLSYNNLRTFPQIIKNNKTIEFLDLSYNDIEFIPDWLLELDNIEKINLRGNSFQNVPEEIWDKDPKEIFHLLSILQENYESKPLNECKMIVLGSGGVGKTSLINMLLYGTFNPSQQKTDGIQIKPWKLSTTTYKDFNKNKKNIRLNVWDFGGQEIMHATHQFFMSKRSLYLLVLNPRIDDKYGDTEIYYWLKLISSISPNSPIIIVVNKSDTHKADFAIGEIRDSYKNVVGLIETSCTKNIGIEELREKIFNSINRIEHIEDKVPISFFKIRQKLENVNSDYIHFQTYVNICKRIDNTLNDTTIRTYIKLLNDLGIMLNISDNRRLENTQVLNPEWVTNGVYSIINSRKIIENSGVIEENQIAEILDSKNYPTAIERGYILDMMIHFELCYQMPDKKYTYFIPGAFSKEKKFEQNSDFSNKIKFIYQLDVLPSSLISRFIVKVHPFIYQDNFYRNGVYLEFVKEKTFAHVYAVPSKKVINIEITGVGHRRTTLRYLRTEFEKIFRSINKLEVKSFIPIPDKEEHLVDYNDLLIYEEMGEEYILIPAIRKKLNVNSLLEGIDYRLNKKALKTRIASGELDTVFKDLFEFFSNDNEIIAQLSRLNRSNKKILMGVTENNELELNRLTFALLEIVDNRL